MSILNGKLAGSAGLGGPASAGAYSTSTYGMGSMMAQAYSTGSGVADSVRSGDATGALSGKVSLVFLELLVVAIVAFYLWTRSVQGGG